MNACANSSKHRIAVLLLLVAIGWTVTSCGIQFRGRAPRTAPEEEETVDRTDPFADPGDKIIATAVDIGLTDYSSAAYDSLSGDFSRYPGPKETVVTGYDVQYFATLNILEAREVKRQTDTLTTMPVRIIFEEPYYKLIAGPYQRLAEAERFLQQVIQIGYSSAWIISHREETGE